MTNGFNIEITDERVITLIDELEIEYKQLQALSKIDNKEDFENTFQNLKINPSFFYLFEKLAIYIELFEEVADKYNVIEINR